MRMTGRASGLLLLALLAVGAGTLTAGAGAPALGTWSTRPVPGDGEAVADLNCFTSTRCVGVSLFSPQVITTADAGATWRVFKPRDVGRYGFTSVACVAPDTCYATALLGAAPPVGAAIYKSTDGGRRWNLAYRRSRPHDPAFRFSDVACLSDARCLVSGSDGSTGFILTTFDGGRDWTTARLPAQPRGGSILGIDCAAVDACFAVQDTSARVYKSTDGGRRWFALPVPANFAPYEHDPDTPTGLSAISCGSPSFCVAGGYIGHLNLTGTTQPFKWVTRDGGLRWSYTNPFASTGAKTPSAVSQNAISCNSANDCTMGLSYGYVYSTTDQGRNWAWENGAPLSDNDVLSVACLSASHCLVSAMSNFPKRSVFAGMLWTER